jgi:hypothetical protein
MIAPIANRNVATPFGVLCSELWRSHPRWREGVNARKMVPLGNFQNSPEKDQNLNPGACEDYLADVVDSKARKLSESRRKCVFTSCGPGKPEPCKMAQHLGGSTMVQNDGSGTLTSLIVNAIITRIRCVEACELPFQPSSARPVRARNVSRS